MVVVVLRVLTGSQVSKDGFQEGMMFNVQMPDCFPFQDRSGQRAWSAGVAVGNSHTYFCILMLQLVSK